MRIPVAIFTLAFTCASAQASLVLTTNKEQWLDSAGPVTFLDFTDLQPFEFVTDQYADQGVMFFGTAIGHTSSIYPSDGQGILGWTQSLIELEFDVPRTAFALELGSFTMGVTFYLGDSKVGSANLSNLTSLFWGVFAESGFDRVTLTTQLGTAVDNIYFGAPIPAPAGIALLGFGTAALGRRRRRLR